MRLINTETLDLEEYFGDQIPKYAILSHTWRTEEVTYQTWNHDIRKSGFQKIQATCRMAQRDSIKYLWVDTNCINKDSSSELSEAINSMFTWYKHSVVCYVYLDDFHYKGKESLVAFGDSRWFTRGWTLQELLAPSNVQFFDASWMNFGTKRTLLLEITKITSIGLQYLMHPDSIRLASIARRMSWVSTRTTTREEDIAYCLLGIFDINMPLLYGEGLKAFIRLQEEIIRHSNDHTIFCWFWPQSMKPAEITDWQGCLAPKPITFRDSGEYVRTGSIGGHNTDFQITNSGLRITLPIFNSFLDGYKFAMLNAKDPVKEESHLCLCLQSVRSEGFARSRFLNNRLLDLPRSWAQRGESIYLSHERDPNRKVSSILSTDSIYPFRNHPKHSILPVYSSGLNGDKIIPLPPFSWGKIRPDTFGPAMAMRRSNKENRWQSDIKMRFKIPSKETVDIKLNVFIDPDEEDLWLPVIMTVSVTDEKGYIREHFDLTEDIHVQRSYDFTLTQNNLSTVVRPILVPFATMNEEIPVMY